MLNKFSNRIVKLEDERGTRGCYIFEFLQSTLYGVSYFYLYNYPC